MLQSEPPLHDESTIAEPTPRRSRWRAVGKFAEIALLAAAMLTIIGVAIFSVKVATGVTRELDTPAEPMRLQIVNGSGVAGAEERLARQLNGFTGEGLNILVVETSTFDMRKIMASFVVSRQPDDQMARHFAKQLGLEPTDVIYEPLDNNVRSVGVTLVLGEDYYKIRLAGTETKE